MAHRRSSEITNMDVLADLCKFWNWYFFSLTKLWRGMIKWEFVNIFYFFLLSTYLQDMITIIPLMVIISLLPFCPFFCMSYENNKAGSVSCLRCPLHNHSAFLFTTIIMIKFFLDYHFWICSFFKMIFVSGY